jgi:hypothetical protein
MMEKPATQRAMLEQLWFVLIGTNGDGLIERFKMFVKESKEHNDQVVERINNIDKVLPTLRTHIEQEATELADKKTRQNERNISTRDWIMIIIVALGVFIPTLISLLEHKL